MTKAKQRWLAGDDGAANELMIECLRRGDFSLARAIIDRLEKSQSLAQSLSDQMDSCRAHIMAAIERDLLTWPTPQDFLDGLAGAVQSINRYDDSKDGIAERGPLDHLRDGRRVGKRWGP